MCALGPFMAITMYRFICLAYVPYSKGDGKREGRQREIDEQTVIIWDEWLVLPNLKVSSGVTLCVSILVV